MWRHLHPGHDSSGLLAAQRTQRTCAREGNVVCTARQQQALCADWLLTCSAIPPKLGTASKPFAGQLHSCSAAACLVFCQGIASVYCAHFCQLDLVECRFSHERQNWKHSAWLHPVLAWMEASRLPTAWLQVTVLLLSPSPATAEARRQCLSHCR